MNDGILFKLFKLFVFGLLFLILNAAGFIFMMIMGLPNGDGSSGLNLIDLPLITGMVFIPITWINLLLSKVSYNVHNNKIAYKVCKNLSYIGFVLYVWQLIDIYV